MRTRRISGDSRNEPPVLLVKWYDVTKWLLERVDSFPKSQRFIFGQRIADRTLNVLESLVEAAYSPRKADLLARVNRLSEVKYECLGCEVCWPPLAMNALNIDGEACPADSVEARAGWPPLPGGYKALRYHAPVAICTLTDEELAEKIGRDATAHVAIVGSLYTENLGIERIVQNVVANPHIRFLIVCGPDSRQTIGHLPGQSLVALARSSVDERMRIVGARGRRPVLRNVSREAVEHFRRTVEVEDMVGSQHSDDIFAKAADCAARDPGPADAFPTQHAVSSLVGYLPERMTSDPNGYFVVYVDRQRGLLSLEHYANSGVLDVVVEGRSAAQLYTPAIERGLISRLDHAAYLGRELARAERALAAGEEYVQDGAPERGEGPAASCRCGHDSSVCGPSPMGFEVADAEPQSPRRPIPPHKGAYKP